MSNSNGKYVGNYKILLSLLKKNLYKSADKQFIVECYNRCSSKIFDNNSTEKGQGIKGIVLL